MKKYKTWEVIKMLTENPNLKFQTFCRNYKRIFNCSSYGNFIVTTYRNDEEIDSSLGQGNFNGNISINTEWELLPQEVSFLDAIKAHGYGKTIYCICEDKLIYEPKTKDYNECLEDDCGNAVSPKEILKGHWYIQDEEDAND